MAESLTAATRRSMPPGGLWEWSGTANDCTARHLTADPTLTVFVRPVFTQHTQGVELIDQHGARLASEVRDPGAW